MQEDNDVNLPTIESEKIRLPDFLLKLAIDYPEVADKIKAKLPQWKENVDRLMGIEGFSDIVLNQIEYISKEEEEEFFLQVREEIKSKLESNQALTIYFLIHSIRSRSGNYFFNAICNGLSDSNKERLKKVTAIEFNEMMDEGMVPTEIYFCDDSSNSGSQLVGQTINLLPRFSRGEMGSSSGEKINLHIRLLRIDHKAEVKINDLLKRLENAIEVSIDVEAKPIANMKDIATHFGITSLSSPEQQYIFNTHHQMGIATLAIFYHKLQDNLSPLLIPGRAEKELAKHGIKPLFEQETENQIFYPDYPISY